ncbi:hypothetical protein FW754_15350 [Acinetobacter sp. 1207_04]|uniref:hypothetical protein n=1 Tax=Acinetobacter sp. 1207_04 TaxID=2604449 RepID=UPI004058C3B1
MKEIKNYIGYYLLVYIFTLLVCGLFQYIIICAGKSINCIFDTNSFNTIITTTAYVLTPIIAIIGFHSWKEQYNINLEKNDLLTFRKDLHSLNKIVEYFNVHFRELFESIDKQKTGDFEKIILNYKDNIIEVNQKRRDFSMLSIDYFHSLDYYLKLNLEFNDAEHFEKINQFGSILDILIEMFNENEPELLKNYYNSFNKKYEILNSSIKNLIIDTDKKLRI